MQLEKRISSFLSTNKRKSSPFLLALSGGPDSLALFYLLIEEAERLKIPPSDLFAVAHVDHGWREESKQEAAILKELASRLSIPFHLKYLDPSNLQGNLESACRLERLKFFASLCQTYKYQAVMLGHHKDDLAETVLKRVLEGASLSHLGSMKEVSAYESITLWRPLLSSKKQELIDWLASLNLIGFDDSTNRDTRFLRANMRIHILPTLANQFGKEVVGNLALLGKEAVELQDYLEQKTKTFYNYFYPGIWGVLLDCRSYECAPFELKYFIKKLSAQLELALSRESVVRTAELLLSKASNKKILAHKYSIYIDRGVLFIFQKLKSLNAETVAQGGSSLLGSHKLIDGEPQCGGWRLKVSTLEDPVNGYKCSGWMDLWRGRGEVILPKNKYYLAAPILTLSYPREKNSLNQWWNKEKVPQIFRSKIPVLYSEDGEMIHEFLSGRLKTDRTDNASGKFQKIEIIYSDVIDSKFSE